MYLYVAKADGIKRVPEALLAQFGKPALFTTLFLDDTRHLARVDIHKVLESIENIGYFLQIPPQIHSLLDDERQWQQQTQENASDV